MKDKIRKIFNLFVCLLVGISFVASNNALAGSGDKVIGELVTSGTLRYCPFESCEALDILEEGAKLRILGINRQNKNHEWYLVMSEDGIPGSMHYSSFTVDFRSVFLNENTVSFILLGNELLREAPSAASMAYSLDYGLAELQERQGDWYRIKTTQEIYWVSYKHEPWGEFLVMDKPIIKDAWIHESLVPVDIKQLFVDTQQEVQVPQTEEQVVVETKEVQEIQEKSIARIPFFKNESIQVSLIFTFVFVALLLGVLLVRKRGKIIFQFKGKVANLRKKRMIANYRGLLIVLLVVIVLLGITYGATGYYKTSKLVKEAARLTELEEYDEAIGKLTIAQVGWLTENLGIKKEKIESDIKKNERLAKEKTRYEEGLEKFAAEGWQEAIEVFSELPEDSFYYQNAQLQLKEAEKRILGEELAQEKVAKEKAEQKAREEAIKKAEEEAARKEAEEKKKQEEIARMAAEEKARTEEKIRKSKEQELSAKEAEEKKMSADNDGDGLTYRRELELGTSDYDSDSDDDGLKDAQDLHPAGGGRGLAQDFTWSYGGTNWEYKLSIPEDWYEYYKNLPRELHGTKYVTEDDPYIQAIADKVKNTATAKGYHTTSFLVSFIQSLPYVEDYYTTFDEYPKYPVETIIDRNGDCEDTSYLFASLVGAMNLGAALIEFDNHMGIGVKTEHSQSGYYYSLGDDWYYYYETTGEGWEVGDLPNDLKYKRAKVTPIWDTEGQYVYASYKKPCEPSLDFAGYYYSDGSYYSDAGCNYLVNCLPWSNYISDSSLSGYYYQPQLKKTYHDSSCTQLLVIGCYKSKSYPGYFYKSGIAWYYDSQCIQLYQSMACSYPSSWSYSCTSESSYNSKKSTCDYYASSKYLKDLAPGCYDGLDKCRDDINEYQNKLNEYNNCLNKKEY